MCVQGSIVSMAHSQTRPLGLCKVHRVCRAQSRRWGNGDLVMLNDLPKVTKMWRQLGSSGPVSRYIVCLKLPLEGLMSVADGSFVVGTGCLPVTVHCLPSYFPPLPLLLASEERLTSHQNNAWRQLPWISFGQFGTNIPPSLTDFVLCAFCGGFWFLKGYWVLCWLSPFFFFEEFTDWNKGTVFSSSFSNCEKFQTHAFSCLIRPFESL